MHRIGLGLAFGMFLAVASVAAQSSAPINAAPRAEVALGYTYVRARTVVTGGCCFNMNGGSASATTVPAAVARLINPSWAASFPLSRRPV